LKILVARLIFGVATLLGYQETSTAQILAPPPVADSPDKIQALLDKHNPPYLTPFLLPNSMPKQVLAARSKSLP
jgi:hypothetical protein